MIKDILGNELKAGDKAYYLVKKDKVVNILDTLGNDLVMDTKGLTYDPDTIIRVNNGDVPLNTIKYTVESLRNTLSITQENLRQAEEREEMLLKSIQFIFDVLNRITICNGKMIADMLIEGLTKFDAITAQRIHEFCEYIDAVDNSIEEDK